MATLEERLAKAQKSEALEKRVAKIRSIVPFRGDITATDVSDETIMGMRDPTQPGRAFERGIVDVGEGIKQAGLEVGESLGVVERGSAATYTEEVRARREQFERENEGIPGTNVNRFLGQMLPYSLVPGQAGRTFSSRVLGGAGIGGGIGFTQFVDDELGESRALNTVLGTIFGGAINFGFEVPILHKRYINKKIAATYNSPLTERVVRKGKKLQNATGTPLKASEETGSLELLALEQAAESSPKTAEMFLLQRNKALQSNFRNLRDTAAKIGDKLDDAKLGKKIAVAYEDTAKALRNERRKNWDIGMDRVKAIAGDNPILEPSSLRESLSKIANELSDPLAGADANRAAKTALKFLNEIGDENLTIDRVNNLLKFYTQGSKGKANVIATDNKDFNRSISNELKNALLADIQQAGDSIAGEAGQLLKQVRAQWGVDSQAIDSLGRSVVSKLMARRYTPGDEEFVNAVLKLKPSLLKETMSILDDYDPSIMNSVRRKVLEDAFDLAKKPPSALPSEFPYDPNKLLNALPNKDDFLILFGDRITRKELVQNIQIARRLADAQGAIATGGTAQSAEAGRLIGGAIQQGGAPDAVFIGGFVAKHIAPKTIATILLDPQARTALQTLGNKKAPASQINAALITLASYMDGAETE